MNIFNKLIENQNAVEMTLGNPLVDPLSIARRLTYFMHLRGGKGFREQPKGPRKDAQGLTRGDRKRIARNLANEKVH